jgi:hypothetical protein
MIKLLVRCESLLPVVVAVCVLPASCGWRLAVLTFAGDTGMRQRFDAVSASGVDDACQDCPYRPAAAANRTICQRVICKGPPQVMLADFGSSKGSCWHNLVNQLFHLLSDENSESTSVFLLSSTFQRYPYLMLA